MKIVIIASLIDTLLIVQSRAFLHVAPSQNLKSTTGNACFLTKARKRNSKLDWRQRSPLLSTPFDEEGETPRSAALEWASEQRRELGLEQEEVSTDRTKKKKKFVVVGGGWAGWGAAKTLCQSDRDAHVILIDALPDPTGSTPYLSMTGKPVEAGTRGFWKVRARDNAPADVCVFVITFTSP